MPAPKATSHGFGGAGGAAGAVTLISAARAGVANATAATADKMILLIAAPLLLSRHPGDFAARPKRNFMLSPSRARSRRVSVKSTHEAHSKAKAPAIA